MERFFREPINGLTHLFGAFLSIIALILMVIKAIKLNGFGLASLSVCLFGLSLILLYSASATYHLVKAKDNAIAFLRRLDHSMIFILIGGSYMPYLLIGLEGKSRVFLTTLIIILTILGVLFKMIWFNCPRWLSTLLYIGMGWISIFAIPYFENIPAEAMLWLLIGGILYTLGGIIYATKPKFLNYSYFGFHEIFHIFILLGSLSHFISVFFFLLK
ncbi:PAQR family membrane homeostasis protein TrhA [Clostridium tarantellae]|uniref:Hemolysin III family protein n=1 Tax=Clostridium tarantellae TaxID=39493 RepID=A0A6I1MKI3_9CLOT|nr:hemolysin III family protein [Clostridium tarantellae]MPQ43223.1 hemolysin III family protein [Clostridium tarantellae]